MDIRDFIRNMFGQPNDQLSRSVIQNEISMYFDQHHDIDHGFCQCDDTNNPPESVRDGKLNVAMHFTVDGVLFVGVGQVDPLNQSVVDAEVSFFLQHTTHYLNINYFEPSSLVTEDFITLHPREGLGSHVTKLPGGTEHNETPSVLAPTLGYNQC